MAKRRKNVRRAKKAAPAFSAAEMRALTRLRKSINTAYSNFWWIALGIRPPKPPKIEEWVESLGKSVDNIARILPPPRPPF